LWLQSPCFNECQRRWETINNTLKRVVKTLFIQTYDTVDCNSTLSFFFLHAHELLKADLFLFLLGVFQFLQNSRELLKLQAKLFFYAWKTWINWHHIFFFFSSLTSRQRQINFSFLSSLFTLATLALSFHLSLFIWIA